MSDGGAGAVVEGLKMAAQVRVGRILLWIGAVLFALMALAAHRDSQSLYVFVGLVLAVVATVGGIQARRRNQREAARWRMLRMALGALGLGIVALLLWIKSRRGKAEPLPPPPLPEEVDELARLELEAERAA